MINIPNDSALKITSYVGDVIDIKYNGDFYYMGKLISADDELREAVTEMCGRMCLNRKRLGYQEVVDAITTYASILPNKHLMTIHEIAEAIETAHNIK